MARFLFAGLKFGVQLEMLLLLEPAGLSFFYNSGHVQLLYYLIFWGNARLQPADRTRVLSGDVCPAWAHLVLSLAFLQLSPCCSLPTATTRVLQHLDPSRVVLRSRGTRPPLPLFLLLHSPRLHI